MALRSSAPPKAIVNAFWDRKDDVIHAFWRSNEDELKRFSFRAEHSCFVHADDMSKLVDGMTLRTKLTRASAVSGMRDEGDYTRVTWHLHDHLQRAAAMKLDNGAPGLFASLGVDTFEADVHPVRRWMTDNRVNVARPKLVFLDIEADSRVPFTRKEEARILCWTIRERRGGEWVTKRQGLLTEDTDADEERLLEELWNALAPYDQVAAWSGDNYDFPVIRARTKRYYMRVEFRRWLWLDHMVLFRRMNMSASDSGDEKQRMGLNAVSHAVLGEGKLEDEEEGQDDTIGSRTWDLWSTGRRDLLVRYCGRDTELMALIEEKTGYIELLFTVCEATYTFPDSRGIQPTQQVEGFLMRLAAPKLHRFPTHHYQETVEQFRGALVTDPAGAGIWKDVHVCDFAGLYPSIILTWNMSPETWRSDLSPAVHASIDEAREPPEGCAVAAITGQVFDQEPRGLLCEALDEMLRLRKFWSDKQAECVPGTVEAKEANRRSAAYKICANSFYGVVGSPFSRFFVRQVAESVAQQGVFLISEVAKLAESKGYQVRYIDTDGAFVTGCSRAAFGEFVDECNATLFPRLLEQKGCARNYIKLAYEKAFSRLTMVSAKRYVGMYAHYKGKDSNSDSKPEIKGLEYKRGDTVKLARVLQEQVAHMIVGYKRSPSDDPGDFVELIAKTRDRIREEQLDVKEVLMSKRLAKEIDAYVLKPKKRPRHLRDAVGWHVVTVHRKKTEKLTLSETQTHETLGRAVRGTLVAVEREAVVIRTARGEETFKLVELNDWSFYASRPQHVEVAAMLLERGHDARQGTRIEYVVVDDRVKPTRCMPAVDYDGQFDREYLWSTSVWPPTERLLSAAFPGAKEFDRFRKLVDPVVMTVRQTAFGW